MGRTDRGCMAVFGPCLTASGAHSECTVDLREDRQHPTPPAHGEAQRRPDPRGHEPQSRTGGAPRIGSASRAHETMSAPSAPCASGDTAHARMTRSDEAAPRDAVTLGTGVHAPTFRDSFECLDDRVHFTGFVENRYCAECGRDCRFTGTRTSDHAGGLGVAWSLATTLRSGWMLRPRRLDSASTV